MADQHEQRSDADLVAAVNAGNWAAFDALYYRHRDWAQRLAWRFTADADDAQDTVQEVFVYLAGKFRSGGLDLRASLTTLLYPAIKHTALAIRRKRQRLKSPAEDQEIVAPPVPSDPAAQRANLASVLASLTDAHREIVLMRFVDDMTLEEIATALAIPLGTAKSRLHHALAALREDSRLRRYFEP